MYLIFIAARITTSMHTQYKDHSTPVWRDCIFMRGGRRNPE